MREAEGSHIKDYEYYWILWCDTVKCGSLPISLQQGPKNRQ